MDGIFGMQMALWWSETEELVAKIKKACAEYILEVAPGVLISLVLTLILGRYGWKRHKRTKQDMDRED